MSVLRGRCSPGYGFGSTDPLARGSTIACGGGWKRAHPAEGAAKTAERRHAVGCAACAVTPPTRSRPIGPELPPVSVFSGGWTAARCWPRTRQTHLSQTLTTVLTVVADCASSRSELVLDAVLPAA